jgi:hypothetical protein
MNDAILIIAICTCLIGTPIIVLTIIWGIKTCCLLNKIRSIENAVGVIPLEPLEPLEPGEDPVNVSEV